MEQKRVQLKKEEFKEEELKVVTREAGYFPPSALGSFSGFKMGRIILISTPEFWLRVDLDKMTLEPGVNEG